MGGDVAKITLRQLMTMFGGFDDYLPESDHWDGSAKAGGDYVDLLVERLAYPGTTFWYSDVSAHLVAAVLAAALERADGDRPRTILDYAREKLFDPLGISTRPAFSRPLQDVFAPGFAKPGFGWGTDPDGIQLGAYGLRLTVPDMMKIGELYRRDGVWNGQQIVPVDWIQQSTSPSEHNEEYGLLWWIIAEPDGPGYAAWGRGGQAIIVLPKSRAVIVSMASVQPDMGDQRHRYRAPERRTLHRLSVTAARRRCRRSSPATSSRSNGSSPTAGPSPSADTSWSPRRSSVANGSGSGSRPTCS